MKIILPSLLASYEKINDTFYHIHNKILDNLVFELINPIIDSLTEYVKNKIEPNDGVVSIHYITNDPDFIHRTVDGDFSFKIYYFNGSTIVANKPIRIPFTKIKDLYKDKGLDCSKLNSLADVIYSTLVESFQIQRTSNNLYKTIKNIVSEITGLSRENIYDIKYESKDAKFIILTPHGDKILNL